VTLDLMTARPRYAQPAERRLPWRERMRERRRLAYQDRLAAHLAELHHIRALVAGARTVVRSGWVQDGWFAYRDEQGQQRAVTAQNVQRMEGRPVTGACLVGAIVQAGGGLAAVHSQPVQRALDLTWHTLYGDERERVRWCPAPSVRTAHVRDLTRWNDDPDRSPREVTALLHTVERAAATEIERLRA
jgi:hypothetical protein